MSGNHLVGEKSPYLLQHAHNPVDWYPWGDAAVQRARAEDKPLLLSIGYSTCHWCHVMEHESFSDASVAQIMNRHFVSVKLDREERPDVDKIYMTAVQAMTGQGGWPLNVFLTPGLEPFFGGTYFPPKARWGQPSWQALLERIAELWKTKRPELLADASRLTQAVKSYAAAEGRRAAPEAAWLERGLEFFESSYDSRNGGFGGAPKFPMPVNLNFLLREHQRSGKPRALAMAAATLRAMAAGGLQDHVGGGFHRYSTDAEWRVPHFEKMLYDNAQLAGCFVEGYQATGDEELARVARRTLGYLLRDLRHPEGAFFSAEDADSAVAQRGGAAGGEKSEGAFYLWTAAEIEAALGPDAAAFSARYGVFPEGNAPADPHGEFTGKNILHEALSVEEAAKSAATAPGDLRSKLECALETLRLRREGRPRPSLDDKILTSWNGLAISAFAKAGLAFGEKAYLDAAEKAASFIRAHLYEEKSGRLWHRWREGQAAVPAISDDYAFLVQGLLDLFEAGGKPERLEWALELTQAQQRLFAAPGGGLYMTAEGHDAHLLARVVEDTDNVEPSASSVGAMNSLRLWRYTQRDELLAQSQQTLERFGGLLCERPGSLPQMLCAAGLFLVASREIVIAGDAERPQTQALLAEVAKRFLPERVLLRLDDSSRPMLAGLVPWMDAIPGGGPPKAYLCSDFSCGQPVEQPQELAQQLDGRRR